MASNKIVPVQRRCKCAARPGEAARRTAARSKAKAWKSHATYSEGEVGQAKVMRSKGVAKQRGEMFGEVKALLGGTLLGKAENAKLRRSYVMLWNESLSKSSARRFQPAQSSAKALLFGAYLDAAEQGNAKAWLCGPTRSPEWQRRRGVLRR